jgi:uncharacterized membrane protein
MKNRSFFSGLEEVFARLLGLFVTLIFFAVYVSAKVDVKLDWYGMCGYLALFWVIYEILSFVLFRAFVFFSKDNEEQKSIDSMAEIAREDIQE